MISPFPFPSGYIAILLGSTLRFPFSSFDPKPSLYPIDPFKFVNTSDGTINFWFLLSQFIASIIWSFPQSP